MEPCGFPESDVALNRPEGWTADECDPLSIARIQTEDGKPVVLSCWKLTLEEMEEFRRTGRIWLMVFGESMPRVALAAVKPI